MGCIRHKTLNGHETYYTTYSTFSRLPPFIQPELAQIVFDAMRFAHENGRLILHGYVLMEDHFHLVGSSQQFSNVMKDLKSYSARRIIDSLKSRG